MQLDEGVVIRIIREEYSQQVAEALNAIKSVSGEDKNVLDAGLKLKLKKNDTERKLPKGTLYTIKSVGNDGVVVIRIKSDEEPEVDSYEAKERVVSYEDLERDFELD